MAHFCNQRNPLDFKILWFIGFGFGFEFKARTARLCSFSKLTWILDSGFR